MSEERFWNTDEYANTAKFAVQEVAMTMRQAGRIFRLDPAPPKADDINDYIISAVRENDLTYFTYFLPFLSLLSRHKQVMKKVVPLHSLIYNSYKE